MNTQLIFASANRNKAAEIQSLLPQGYTVITMKEAGWDAEIPEPYDTLAANSRAKAQTIHAFTGKNVFAEDTGLEVDALNGAPGVKSARYAGEPANDQKNIEKLLRALGHTTRRSARFRTVITLIFEGTEYQFEGVCEGSIAHTPAGDAGFGYDPVFIPQGANHTFAQMGLAEKNRYSHRKKALAAMLAFLKEKAGAH
jgi:XTP/dITP diphosphohydrolase